MKNNFDWTFQDAFEKTNTLFNWIKEDRPAEFEKKTLLNNGKEILISSSGFEAQNKTATFRYARTQSAVVDIATVIIYPTADTKQLPVFACEWVLIQNNIHVIALDIVWLEHNNSANKFYSQLAQVHSHWAPIFPEKKEIPQWFKEIASEVAVFSEAGISQIAQLQQFFNQYLDKWMEWAEQLYSQLLPGPDNELVKKFKHHHYTNSPAKTIIKGDNEAWLNTFLKEYHFA